MRPFHQFARAVGGAVLVCVAVAGCSKEDVPQALETVDVQGKVVMPDGSPGKGLKVDFQPADPAGVAGQGYTKPDGTFKTTTRGGQPGIVAGAYKVTVSPSSDESIAVPDYEAAKKALPTPKTLDLTVNAQSANVAIDLKK